MLEKANIGELSPGDVYTLIDNKSSIRIVIAIEHYRTACLVTRLISHKNVLESHSLGKSCRVLLINRAAKRT